MALKPGNRAPASGQYEQVGPRGGRTGHEVTTVRGGTAPPDDEARLDVRHRGPDAERQRTREVAGVPAVTRRRWHHSPARADRPSLTPSAAVSPGGRQ